MLTKFVDSNTESGPGRNHGSSAVRSVKELEQSRHKLVLVFVVSQTAIAAESPSKYAAFPIENDLRTTDMSQSTGSRSTKTK